MFLSSGVETLAAPNVCSFTFPNALPTPHSGIPSAQLGLSLDAIPLSTPVQLHTGELDNLKGFSDPDSFRKLHESMLKTIKAAGGPHAKGLHKLEEALFIYPGEGHAFCGLIFMATVCQFSSRT